jgi:hypothetical protein
MKTKFTLPTNIISNNVVKNVLYVITLAFAISYIINEENIALISLALIACGVYAMNKNIVSALFISIIITNILLAMNYFKNNSLLENVENMNNCCPGQPFYNSNVITYNTISYNTANKTICDTIERDISINVPSGELPRARFFELLYENNEYMKAKSICNTLNVNNSIYNMKGSLFQKTDTSVNVLDDVNILPKDILDILAFSDIKNRLDESNLSILESAVIAPLELMNTYLFDISREQNLQRPANISDLTGAQRTQLISIKDILKNLFDSSNTKSLTKLNTTYTLVNKTTYQPVINSNTGTPYLLQPDQFFDCSGTLKINNSGTFSQSNIIELSNNDFFGTSGIPIARGGLGDASYNPYGTQTPSDLYPSNKDLELELRRLQTLPSSGNVPVNIISTYLNAINTFYEKQIQNLTSTRSSTFSQTPINDIYSIRTMKPTFFTYDNTSNNNTYQCENSITGNSAFKYCGPAAYYEIPKF